MHRHLYEAHGFKAKKFWRCSICEIEDTGLRMNVHYRRCAKNRISDSPATASRETDPIVGGDPTTPAGTASNLGPSPSPHTILTPAPMAETALTARYTESVLTPSAMNGPALGSVEPLSDERAPPTEPTASNPPQEIVTPYPGGRGGLRRSTPSDATPDNGNPPRTETNVEEEWINATRRFHLTWSQAVSNRSSLTNLEEILANCVAEWRSLASKGLNDKPDEEHGRRQRQRCQSSQNNAQEDDEAPTRAGKGRNQSRQMQRARRKNKFDKKEASRIQHLFRIYPRRAVRQILMAQKHLKEKHDGLALKFKCARCGDEFASLHGGRRHYPCRRSIAPSPPAWQVAKFCAPCVNKFH